MRRFDYNTLTGDQFRIALALMGADYESAVIEALEKAAETAVADTLATFGLGSNDAKGAAEVRPAGANKRGRKGSRWAKPKAQSAGDAKPVKASKPASKSGKLTAGLTPEQRESRALQGKYLVAIRRVPKGKRGGYKNYAKEHGRRKAIAAIDNDYPPSAK